MLWLLVGNEWVGCWAIYLFHQPLNINQILPSVIYLFLYQTLNFMISWRVVSRYLVSDIIHNTCKCRSIKNRLNCLSMSANLMIPSGKIQHLASMEEGREVMIRHSDSLNNISWRSQAQMMEKGMELLHNGKLSDTIMDISSDTKTDRLIPDR